VRAHDPRIIHPSADAVAPPTLRPHAIVEAPVVRELLAAGTVVVCAAGGGIPVIREPGTGRLVPVEAIADPERMASLLAALLDADALLFLTARTHLFAARSRGRARPLLHLTPEELSTVRLSDQARATAEAAAEFVTGTGGVAGVGPADNALGILQEMTGTLIRATAPAGASE
jgi:carbamate kinase